jgi:hypothetical protein
MKKVIKHIMIPAMVSVIFFAIAAMPVELLGCYNRGLIAAIVAIAAGVLGVVAAGKALKEKIRGEANSSLWMASALIFAIPAIFIVLTTT